MAIVGRLFNVAAEEGMVFDGTPPVAAVEPYSMSALVNSDATALTQSVLSFWVDGSNDNRSVLEMNATENALVHSRDIAPTRFVRSTNSWSANVWHVPGGTWASNSSRTVYLDGAGKATDGNTVNQGVPNVFGVANLVDVEWFSGVIGPSAIWGAVLTDSEHLSLAKGAWIPYVSSANLAIFLPMYGQGNTEPDVVGGMTLVGENGGGTAAGHKNLCPWPGQQQ